jgi:hypothetical protein
MSMVFAVALLGWLQRWTRYRVLRGWWRAGPDGADGPFEDFLARRLPPGADVPARLPRWFLRQPAHLLSLRETVEAPCDGRRPGRLRRGLRWLVTPAHSLGLNFAAGVRCLFGTCLLLAPGVLLMFWGWEFGWVNSFHKGYEQAPVGPITVVLGMLLFTAAMFYVPLAQVHVAMTGKGRAFFDFRVVWRLARTRPLGNVMLAFVSLLFGLVLEVLKTAPLFFPWCDMDADATAADYRELLGRLTAYYLFCCLVLFVLLLLTHALAARLYRLSLRTALRRGALSRQDLPPALAAWLDRLGGLPEPIPPRRGVVAAGLWTTDRVYRLVAVVAVFLIWVHFAFKTIVGEFFLKHPYVGYLNHPQVQLPFFNFIPPELEKDAKGESG